MPEPRPTIAEPAAAATIMLLRDSEQGVEVFMQQRNAGTDFARSHVFPGGLAASSDFAGALEAFCDGLSDAEASAQLGLESGGLALWVAAIRECFEESGYLLARSRDGRLAQPADPSHAARFADYRRALSGGALSMQQVCEEADLTLTSDAIEYVSFWTTPVQFPRRYATRFFVAAVPHGQVASVDGREAVHGLWVPARQAVDGRAEAPLRLHPPTLANLRWLAQFDSADAAMRSARQQDKSAIREILPVVDSADGRVRITLPDGTVMYD